jgi:hypothetical protein
LSVYLSFYLSTAKTLIDSRTGMKEWEKGRGWGQRERERSFMDNQ